MGIGDWGWGVGIGEWGEGSVGGRVWGRRKSHIEK